MDQGNAKDLYALALKAVEYREYLNISRNARDYIDGGEIKLNSTNALLGKVEGVDGLKTGYHKAAGSNIILTAQIILTAANLPNVELGGRAYSH